MKATFPRFGAAVCPLILLALLLHGCKDELGSGEDDESAGEQTRRSAQLWVSSPYGIVRLSEDDGRVLKRISRTAGVRALAFDGEAGRLWGYGHSRLRRFTPEGERELNVYLHQFMGDRGHFALAVDPQRHEAWVASYRSLHHVNEEGESRRLDLSRGPVRALALDLESGKALWLAADGLYRVDAAGNEEPILTLAEHGRGRALARDPRGGRTWLATDTGVLALDDAGHIVLDKAIADIRHLAADDEGVWLASETTLVRLHASGAVAFTLDPLNAFEGEKVRALAPDHGSGGIWVLGGEVLVRVDNQGVIDREIDKRHPFFPTGPARDLVHHVDTDLPELVIERPATNERIAEERPEVALHYPDGLEAMDEDTLELAIDREAIAAACDFDDTEAVCVPESELPEGELRLDASVESNSGVRVEAEAVYLVIDVTPPEITLEAPADGLWTNEPGIEVRGGINEPGDVTVNGNAVELDLERNFSTSVALEEGANEILVAAVDEAGNEADERHTVHLDTEPPEALNEEQVTIGNVEDGELSITGTAGAAEPGTEVRVHNQASGETYRVSAAEDGSFSVTVMAEPGDELELTVEDRAGNQSETMKATARSAGVPPNPEDVASSVSVTGTTHFSKRNAFLYTGPDPVQKDADPDAFEPERSAVVAGRVVDRDGAPISGVRISIKDHPEYGYTRTRADGAFDMAVNGGGRVVVEYEKEGRLPAQRRLRVPWNDYRELDEVVLIPLDEKVTVIDLQNGEGVQAARGSQVEDEDGARQATVLFPEGVSASITLADGEEKELDTLSVRATEYTVGGNGPETMPGKLPPTTGYTYAVELSVDEALESGVNRVDFDKPVPLYVENFVGFPVGGTVPTGWYDFDKAAWISSDNGRVIEILSIVDGRAEIDIEGEGIAASGDALAEIGITEAERKTLASLYEPGDTLWRSPLDHFTPWDCNWPYGPPEDPDEPDVEETDRDDDEPCPDEQSGSIVECQNQVLGKRVPVPHIEGALNYRSSNVPGRSASRAIEIPLTGENPDSRIIGITLQVEVAGVTHREHFSVEANKLAHFEWDGKDRYGRRLTGSHPATVRVGYTYQAVYYDPADLPGAFGQIGGSAISGSRRAATVTLWDEDQFTVSNRDMRETGIGGWSHDAHHWFDAGSGTLHMGDGQRISSADLLPVVEVVAGNGDSYEGHSEGQLAVDTGLTRPRALAVAPDGQVYFIDTFENIVWRVDREGRIYEAGERRPGDPVIMPSDIALGPEGQVYIASSGTIRKLGDDGYFEIIAGLGSNEITDGIAAQEADLRYMSRIALDDEGVIYFTESVRRHYGTDIARIWKIENDVLIRHVAGGDDSGFSGDGGSARDALLDRPRGIEVDQYGFIYFSDAGNRRIRRIGPDGIIETIAGTGQAGSGGDGGPALSARVPWVDQLVYTEQGDLFFGDESANTVRRINGEGNIYAEVGTGERRPFREGEPARKTNINNPSGVAVGPDRSLYVAARSSRLVLRVRPPVEGAGLGTTLLPSPDGEELFEFDEQGRHLRTLNSMTGEETHVFEYDADGRLEAITTADGLETRIERTAAGGPVGLRAPFGHVIGLETDTNGFLSAVEAPSGARHEMHYEKGGLLTSFVDPNGHPSSYTHDEQGRLLSTVSAEGGGWEIERHNIDKWSHMASMTSAEGRSYSYRVEREGTDSVYRTNVEPDGTSTVSERLDEGVLRNTASSGTVTETTRAPDPRFGMAAPITAERIMRTPSGLESVTERQVELEVDEDTPPGEFQALVETVLRNGREHRSRYDTDSRTFVETSPAGIETRRTLDGQGRVVELSTGDLAPARNTYNDDGQLVRIAQGENDERLTRFEYEQGLLARTEDALGRENRFEYDPDGRLRRHTREDGTEVEYLWDANGNLTALLPPGRSAHVFEYDGEDRETRYDPPELDGIDTVTRYHYNLDGDLTGIERPGGEPVQFRYDAGGRLSERDSEDGLYQYQYNDAGQLASLTGPAGMQLDYGYDGFLPVSRTWSGEITGEVRQHFDDNFWLTGIEVNGETTELAYNPDGLLTRAGALTLDHDPVSALLTSTELGQVTTAYGYNVFGEPVGKTAAIADTPALALDYQRDALGRITERTETRNGTTEHFAYEYNEAGYLTQVTRNGAIVESYAYDENGNRISAMVEGESASAEYDAQDRLVQYGDAEYEYTANGELKRKLEGSDETLYSYDAFGNLRDVTLPDGTEIEYLIDGQDRRVGRKVDGELVQGFLYQDQLNPVAELDGNGAIRSLFVYADKANVPTHMIREGSTYRIISDHLGSPRKVTDTETGEVVQQMRYDSFGNVTEDTNPGFQPFGFAGGIYDRDTGLIRFGARDYDPETGRWTAKDPIRFDGDGPNLYGYVLNDPVNMIDPEGLEGLFGFRRGSIGFGASIQQGGVGASVSGSVGIDTNGRVCMQVTTCARGGPGASGGVTGQASVGRDPFCEGFSGSGGVFAEAGKGKFGGGSVETDGDSIDGTVNVRMGAGAGASAGAQFCTTKTRCIF